MMRATEVVLVLLLWTLAGCATPARPTPSPGERWRTDVDAYAERRGRFVAEVRQALDDFKALAAEASFAGLDARLATLAARVAAGDEPDDAQTLVRGLWSLTLGELTLFQRYLALSSRVVELEAAHAELEAARLELLLRKLRLGPAGEAPGGATVVGEPLRPPVDCPRRRVGGIEFVSCR